MRMRSLHGLEDGARVVENKMETTVLQGIFQELYRDNGKEHGNDYIIGSIGVGRK